MRWAPLLGPLSPRTLPHPQTAAPRPAHARSICPPTRRGFAVEGRGPGSRTRAAAGGQGPLARLPRSSPSGSTSAAMSAPPPPRAARPPGLRRGGRGCSRPRPRRRAPPAGARPYLRSDPGAAAAPPAATPVWRPSPRLPTFCPLCDPSSCSLYVPPSVSLPCPPHLSLRFLFLPRSSNKRC